MIPQPEPVYEDLTAEVDAIIFMVNAGDRKGIENILRSSGAIKQQAGEQCSTCKHTNTRACQFHGYPDSEIPNSCPYKLGVFAESAMRNLTGTFIDVWTKEHDAAIRAAAKAEGAKEEREKILNELQNFASEDVPTGYLDQTAKMNGDWWRKIESLRGEVRR